MNQEMRALTNRLNAMKSTGARTLEGLARSRKNALKHGLLAKNCVMDGEEESGFETLREEIFVELRPVGQVEVFLVARVVAMMWRLRRIPGLEREMIEYQIRRRIRFVRRRERNPDAQVTLGELFAEECRDGDSFSKLRRYESHFERALIRDLHELERRQMARQGKVVAAPQAIDVTVSVDESPGEVQDAA
jgi:hypothetical protein